MNTNYREVVHVTIPMPCNAIAIENELSERGLTISDIEYGKDYFRLIFLNVIESDHQFLCSIVRKYSNNYLRIVQ